ncbi:ferredoxin--NADP reductase [Pseudomonas sp. N040]|uniref:ferredoxin--NADP reductase n=1 Tax=Pseudomonas sp. N040 TaxID=2785325 RepID=UPI0018A2DB39|nr:ferredoxin--NADP reductase [Pseudomonas sp. N040]MBF7729225.1 ferredoxin--NADP reductase [Pseudomonas sp. N040]MBW7012865.1 ferredoxin--NADP reductase [Pseudomonas sp. N040]
MVDTSDPGAQAKAPNPEEKWTVEKVLSIHYWTPSLVSFRTTRASGFRFTPGHYARLALGSDEALVWRPYSLVSATDDDYLEFIAVLVPGGAFSQHLAKLAVGDAIKVDKACFGFLTVNQLAPGRDLWLLASGTGIGPFLSIVRDPAVWQAFEHLIVVHGVRHSADLAYREDFTALARQPLLAGARATLSYFPAITREPGASQLSGRIPQLLANGRLEQAANLPLSLADSRVMVCGNPDMAFEVRQHLSALGFATGRRGVPGQMAFEKYW